MATTTTAPTAAGAEWKKNLSAHVICPECKEFPPNLEFPGSHETVCGSCGLVLADREIDIHSEWRTFSNDDQNNDDPSRVGETSNILLNGNQLETSIAGGATGAARQLYRAQNKLSSEKNNKALMAAYKEIGALCDGFNIQKIVADTAKYLFKIVDDHKAFKGKSQDAPRTFSEIFAVTKVSRKEIGRIYKSLEKFFTAQNIERTAIVGSDAGFKQTTSTKPSDLCERFGTFLGLDYRTWNAAATLSDKVTKDGDLAGRSPLSIVAACIYMISHLCGVPKSAKEISNVVGVSDGTIRGAYKQLYAERDRLLTDDFIAKVNGDKANLPQS
ncbi:transcription initiation protein [Talaromyces stipitatus ATCC 10500]|uniref:Transcription initiation factor IIB n=1 Tax=Talaromyces stipitatus (strain ATCC 10500 / CBS 375.48 / QM 6759 / NRRL 1006) TaxID=441959 RepID=B8M4I4_TALSN|nr:transcription initiation protein [Talaromyces stipitatus ATCC 10500]EED19179.1 transcription initiation protein [Talaromyces stipitatus ATCC 10500]